MLLGRGFKNASVFYRYKSISRRVIGGRLGGMGIPLGVPPLGTLLQWRTRGGGLGSPPPRPGGPTLHIYKHMHPGVLDNITNHQIMKFPGFLSLEAVLLKLFIIFLQSLFSLFIPFFKKNININFLNICKAFKFVY